MGIQYFCFESSHQRGHKIMSFSFWEKDFIQEKFDFTILGSGISGLSTAISIKERNLNFSVCIIERAPVSLGASTKNAGFSCFGSLSEILEDIENMGEEDTAKIVEMRWLGLEKLQERVPSSAMKYKTCGGVEVFSKDNNEEWNYYLDHLDYANNFMDNVLGLKDTYSKQENTQFSAFRSTTIYNQHEGSLNPMYMMHFLIQKAFSLGIVIHNGINVLEIDLNNKNLIAEGLMIPYTKLCVCTNGFTKKLLPEVEVQAARNQVLMTKPLPGLEWNHCYHFDKGYYYFRTYENRILLGGARNLDKENEFTDSFGNTDKIQKHLLEFLDNIYPNASSQIDNWWSGILGVGESKFPICLWVDEDVLLGVRLGGMGVAIGSHLGELLAKMLVTPNSQNH